ncbi:MAG: hypothetical protein EOS09_22110 [Mesorhizobium sp.]|nr:MAG: hypothetical protein EOS09_22110 [Mesorhizobium sp.]
MRGVPAWHRQHSGQHPSTVLALRANPPSPTRGEGKSALLPPRVAEMRLKQIDRAGCWLTAHSERNSP